MHPDFSKLDEGHPGFFELDRSDFSLAVVDVLKDVEYSLECKIKIFLKIKIN